MVKAPTKRGFYFIKSMQKINHMSIQQLQEQRQRY